MLRATRSLALVAMNTWIVVVGLTLLLNIVMTRGLRRDHAISGVVRGWRLALVWSLPILGAALVVLPERARSADLSG